MKKMILMLMAMVVFGNVFSNDTGFGHINMLEVHDYHGVVFVNVDGVMTGTHSTGIPVHRYAFSIENKALLATILSAKANHSKVKLKGANVNIENDSYNNSLYAEKLSSVEYEF